LEKKQEKKQEAPRFQKKWPFSPQQRVDQKVNGEPERLLKNPPGKI